MRRSRHSSKHRYTPSTRFWQVLLRHIVKLLPHASKGWPGRTLYRRKWLKTYSLRVSLDPAYENAESTVRWEIHDVWMYDADELGRKLLSFRALAKDLEHDRLNRQGIRDIIQSAITENFAS